MTNEQDRSPLDAVIDDVVRNMMQVDARGDFAGRVLQSIEEPRRRAWFSTGPAFAAAALAVIVLIAGTLPLFTRADPAEVPFIEVAAGPPPAFGMAASVPQAAELARPALPAPSPLPATSAESIFGPQRGQVGAATLLSLPQVRLALVLSDATRTEEPRSQTLTMIMSSGERREGRAGGAGQPQLTVEATPEVLPSGAIKCTVAVRAPVQQELTVTLTPGTSKQLLEAVDQQSGRRITIDATATLVKRERPQR